MLFCGLIDHSSVNFDNFACSSCYAYLPSTYLQARGMSKAVLRIKSTGELCIFGGVELSALPKTDQYILVEILDTDNRPNGETRRVKIEDLENY